MDLDEVEAIENIKKERGQYLAIVTEQAGSMKDLLNGRKEGFCTRDQRGKCRAGKMGPAKINLIVLLKHSLCQTKTDRTQTKRGSSRL